MRRGRCSAFNDAQRCWPRVTIRVEATSNPCGGQLEQEHALCTTCTYEGNVATISMAWGDGAGDDVANNAWSLNGTLLVHVAGPPAADDSPDVPYRYLKWVIDLSAAATQSLAWGLALFCGGSPASPWSHPARLKGALILFVAWLVVGTVVFLQRVETTNDLLFIGVAWPLYGCFAVLVACQGTEHSSVVFALPMLAAFHYLGRRHFVDDDSSVLTTIGFIVALVVCGGLLAVTHAEHAERMQGRRKSRDKVV